MIAGIATIDAVVAVGVDLHIELFVQLHQVFGIFRAVLEVDVVVRHAMNQQQVAMQLTARVKAEEFLYPSACSFGVRRKRSP